jgi:hypothetical protein
MRKFFIILTFCIAFSSLAFAASIEQEKMLESIKQEEEEQQKQREQQAVQPVYIIVPTGYFACPDAGKHHPGNRPHPKPHPGGIPNPKPCPIGK